jgi:peptidyl-dipeptidase Dcp
MAASEANERNKHGWVFSLDYPSYSAFLKYSTCRGLKEEIWKAYNSRCLEEYDNRQIMKEIARLRIESARLLGYDKYSEYALESRMAKTPQTVNDISEQSDEQIVALCEERDSSYPHFAETKGFAETLMPWDFFYWSEKYREEKFSLNEESLNPISGSNRLLMPYWDWQRAYTACGLIR